MTARRLIFVLCIGLSGVVASATVVAQPARKAAPKAAPKGKKGPLAPAKDAGAPAKDAGAPAKDSGAPAKSPTPPTKSSATPTGATGAGATTAGTRTGTAPAGEGSAVQMTEDPPPSDMTGTAENPDAPRSALDPPAVSTTAAPPKVVTGYPVEEALRPITLPQNMSEVSLSPHFVVSPFAGSLALRARYGITPKIQLGLTYLVGAVFDDPSTMESNQGFHPGKAVGLDATMMLQDWVGVQIGVPVYISPLALSVTIGAPMKFTFGDKFAIGGLDDFLNIRLDRFAPTFNQELQNATNARDTMTNTIKSQGELRVSLYGIYQYEPDLAIIGRGGIQMEDFTSGKGDGCIGECLTTFIHAGIRYAPRKYVDLGASIGFEDLAHGGSFAPAGFVAFRI